jgi:hypothetical protein
MTLMKKRLTELAGDFSLGILFGVSLSAAVGRAWAPTAVVVL